MIEFFRKIKKKLRLTTVGAVIVLSVLFVFLIITSVIGVIVYLNSDYVRFVRYDDINKVKYAEPTEEAKNFDIDAYIASLPEIDYKKVDYPVKETYEYRFNGYKMTIDIPEGFRAYEIPLTEKPKIRNTKSMKDSCERVPGFATVCAPKQMFWIELYHKIGPLDIIGRPLNGTAVLSDKRLCITQKKSSNCIGLTINPVKSKYKGISTRDMYYYAIVSPNDLDEFGRPRLSTKLRKKKHIVNDRNMYARIGPGGGLLSTDHFLLLDDNQGITMNIADVLYKSPDFNEDLYLSIIDSIKIDSE